MKKTFWSLLISAVMILLMIYLTNSNLFIANTVALWVLAWIYLVFIVRFIYCNWFLRAWKKNRLSKPMSIMIILACCALLMIVLPFKYGEILNNNFIEKNRLNEEQFAITPGGNGSIEIDSIKVDKKNYNMYEIPLNNTTWYFRDGRIHNDGDNTDELVVSIPKGAMYDITFVQNETSGQFEIKTTNGQGVLNLNSSEEGQYKLDWSVLYGTVKWDSFVKCLLYYGLYFIMLSMIVLPIFTWILAEKKDVVEINYVDER